ncbi:MAG: HAD family hydrolase [Tissierellia bacterium]|nr:HAD family hydrolase [Tissierellia bacterium]
MIKIVATDLDETLLNSERKVCKRNIDAIKKAREMGVLIVPSTGRGPGFLDDVLESIDIKSSGNFSILANGGCILDNGSGKIIDMYPMQFEKVKKIFEYAKSKHIPCQIYTTEKAYYIHPAPTELLFADRYPDAYEIYNGDDIEFLKETPIIKMILFDNDLNYLMGLEPDIAKLCNYDLQISYSSDKYMEINEKGVNKGTGLKDICKMLNIDINDSMAIGDNYNDKEMLEVAGISVAVNNAHLLMKEISDYITIANNNEGAVGEAIEKFILNPRKK